MRSGGREGDGCMEERGGRGESVRRQWVGVENEWGWEGGRGGDKQR